MTHPSREMLISFQYAPRAQGKSWFMRELWRRHQEHLAELRRIAHIGIQQAVAALISSYKK